MSKKSSWYGLIKDPINRRRKGPESKDEATKKEIKAAKAERILEPIVYVFWIAAFLFLLGFFDIISLG